MIKLNSLIAWINSHKGAFRFALNEIMRNPLSSIITICVIATAITLPLIFYVSLKNLSLLNNQWGSSVPTISLYLKTGLSNAQTAQFISTLKSNHKVANVTYISPEQALADFKKNTQLDFALNSFKHNPLPPVVVILPILEYQSPSKINFLFQQISQSQLIDSAQIDMHWIKRLYSLIKIGNKITHLLILLFAIAVLLIISNALRSAMINHSEEISILQLIGATDGFIKRPLLYYSVLYTFLGSMLATCITNFFVWLMQSPVLDFVRTYQTQIELQDLSFTESSVIIFFCVLVSFIGSWIMLQRLMNKA